jgi:hypothetical protein
MDFKDYFKQLSERVASLKDQIATEEATKNALIMPFIQMLGYDVFNPLEVVPEMDCDIAKKKGEKIDYAIMKDNEPIMLIECKHWAQDLNLHDTQLKRYFVASKARFGVLTNGVIYRFYSDLVKPNIMDDTPFLEIDLENVRDEQIEELKKFHKSYFDVENVVTSATELKYMTEIKSIIKEEFANPSVDLVKLLTKRVYDGAVTQKVLDQFTDLVKRSLANHINDVLSARLNIAMNTIEQQSKDEGQSAQQDVKLQPQQASEEPLPHGVVFMDKQTGIVTTEDEMESFRIVRAILCHVVDVSRIHYRDTLSYFGILLDDNNRKPICRMCFNAKSVKYIVTFDADKKETKHVIESLEDIYKYSNQLESVVRYYDGENS